MTKINTQNLTKLKESKYDTIEKLKNVTKLKKNQIVTKLISLNWDKSQKQKLWETSWPKIGKKLKKLNCYKTQKL